MAAAAAATVPHNAETPNNIHHKYKLIRDKLGIAMTSRRRGEGEVVLL